MGRKVSETVLFLLLSSLFLLVNGVSKVKATGTIYIRADGSIAPSTSLVSTVDNVTYTVTGNITCDADGIVVERNDTILDGGGYALKGTGNGVGVTLSQRNNITVENIKISMFSTAILLNCSSSCSISGSTITDCGAGISLKYFSDSNSVSANMLTENIAYGIYLLSSCDNNVIFGNIVTNNARGIGLESYCSNDSIFENNVENNGRGIDLAFSSNNSISGNTVAANNGTGIHLESSSNSNGIFGNNITNNGYGIAFEYFCSSNSIFGNNLTSNGTGIHIASSSGNMFYHNNFMNNIDQVYSYNSANAWDDGYPSGGNYWSDYAGVDVKSGPSQNQTGPDAIGDAAYTVAVNNTDRYPLMTQYAIPEFLTFLVLPFFTITTLLAAIVRRKRRPL